MFDWREFLDVARHLLVSPVRSSEEASFRSAATRAYYAAFQTWREALERRAGQSIAPGRSIHAEVLRQLREEPETTAIGLDLDRLRGKRVHADYNAKRSFSAPDAETAIELATEIIGRLPHGSGGRR